MARRGEGSAIGHGLSGTAARVAGLLRTRGMTVDELASELGVSGNAVRLHLARLEREGVVVRTELRPGVSRPAAVYGVSPEAELLFSRAYVPVLTGLLHVLASELTPAAFDRILRRVGHELTAGRARPAGPLRARAQAASDLLNELGGVSRVERQRGGRWLIRGYGCPLSAATRAHPEACSAVESLLGAFVDAPVSACCDRGDRLRCCFMVGGAAPPPARRAQSPTNRMR